MKLELEILTDILPPNGVGKRKPLVKNAKIKRLFNLDEVELEEYIDIMSYIISFTTRYIQIELIMHTSVTGAYTWQFL